MYISYNTITHVRFGLYCIFTFATIRNVVITFFDPLNGMNRVKNILKLRRFNR